MKPRRVELQESLIKNFPKVAQEWDYEKNTIPIDGIAQFSRIEIWWLCDQNHSFKAKVYNRTKGKNCPYCARKLTIKGVNDLNTLYPAIASKLSSENTIKAEDLFPGSGRTLKWIGTCGHQFTLGVREFVMKDSSYCPYCADVRFLAGFNDLKTRFPAIAKYWNEEKNNLTSSNVFCKTNKRYWWQCELGHESFMPVSRKCEKWICNDCISEYKSSGELELFDFIKNIYPDSLSGDRSIIKPFELDVIIPSLNIAIEFNGDYWHSEKVIKGNKNMSAKAYHSLKRRRAKAKGYALYFVWESDWQLKKDMIKNQLLSVFNSPQKRNNSIILNKLALPEF